MKAAYNVGVGVAAIVCYKGKMLFQKRTGAHGASTWAPPGGKLDFGETPQQGVAREVKEETDLDIHSVEYIGYTNDVFSSDELHYITLWFMAKSDTDDAIITEPEKCLEQKWISIQELPTPLFLPTKNIFNNKNAMQELKKYL